MNKFLAAGLKALSLAAALFLLSQVPAAAQETKGSLSGTVVQLAGKGEPVADQEVMLHTLKANQQEKMEHTKTDREGKFKFEGLPTDAEHAYIVMVEHLSVLYSSGFVQFASGENSKAVTIKVAETTTSEKDIILAREHLIFEIEGDKSKAEADKLKVTDIVIIENKGDKAYIGSKELSKDVKEVLRFTLPNGFRQFRGLQGIDANSYAMTDEGFVYALGIPPGISQIAFSYIIDLTSPNYKFTKNTEYYTDKIDLLVADPKLKVESSMLESQGPAKIGNREFLHFAGSGLKKGSPFVVAISTVGFAPGATDWGQHKWIPFTLIAIFIMAGLAYPYLRKRRRSSDGESAAKGGEAKSQNRVGAPYEDLQSEKEDIFAEIARLDERFEAGELEAEEYSRMRLEKKKRLVQVMRTLKEAGIE